MTEDDSVLNKIFQHVKSKEEKEFEENDNENDGFIEEIEIFADEIQSADRGQYN